MESTFASSQVRYLLHAHRIEVIEEIEVEPGIVRFPQQRLDDLDSEPPFGCGE